MPDEPTLSLATRKPTAVRDGPPLTIGSWSGMMPVMHLRCFGWETGLKALPTLLLFNSRLLSCGEQRQKKDHHTTANP
jgi:hypothetical protein